MKKKSKFIHLTLQERNGEKEYTHKIVSQSPKPLTDKQAEKWADKYASDFWGEDGEKNDSGWWEFDFGGIWVRVREVKFITEKEYKVLDKYM